MKAIVSRICLNAFSASCVLATIGCMSYCIFQYALDEDVSKIDFVEYHLNERSIYPSMSVCINKQLTILPEELNKYGTSSSDYINFLVGNSWNDQMVKIDYNKVTINPQDYLLGIGGLTNKFERHFFHPFQNSTWIPKFHEVRIGFQEELYRCLSVDVPYLKDETIRTFSIFILQDEISFRLMPLH